MLPGMTNRSGLTPFERLLVARNDVERLLNGDSQGAPSAWVPPMDVVETNDEILCHIEVPGMTSEDLEIRVEDKLITISGEKKHQFKQERDGVRHMERRYGQFERSFSIPTNVDTDQVRARYENGLLTISLPKSERAKPRRVTIEGSDRREIESK